MRGSDPAGATIVSAFEAIRIATPNRLAVEDETRSLSFGALARAREALAYRLRTRGIGHGDVVSVWGAPSTASVVSFLAVLSLGAVYHPVDVAEPLDRVRHMLVEAGSRLLVVTQGPAPMLEGPGVLVLDDRPETAESGTDELRVPPPHPDDLAYLIFTSGSTGVPKGVEITHRGLAALARFQKRHFRLKAHDRALNTASAGFDASIWEMTLGLLCGGSLVCIPRRDRTPEAMAHALAERNVTVATLTPSYLARLPAVPLRGVRILVSAGEACPTSLVQRWAVGRQFYNAYGPTETTVCATIATCDPASEETPSIGVAVDGMRVDVLDEWMRRVPKGVEGEVFIAGTGLGRGYRNSPALTAASYLPDPFGPPGTRIYRTGDRGIRLLDGSIVFAGRRDRTVKIRGVRVALEEIEGALESQPDVDRAAVLALAADRRDIEIVACISSANPGRALEDRLRVQLGRRLPEQFHPARYKVFREFPLLPSGKVDLAALTANAAAGSLAPVQADEQYTRTERLVAEVWGRHLVRDVISRDDHFLEIGGHSLVAVQVLADLRQALAIQIPVRTLFVNPRLAAFAEAIDALRAQADQSGTTARG